MTIDQHAIMMRAASFASDGEKQQFLRNIVSYRKALIEVLKTDEDILEGDRADILAEHASNLAKFEGDLAAVTAKIGPIGGRQAQRQAGAVLGAGPPGTHPAARSRGPWDAAIERANNRIGMK